MSGGTLTAVLDLTSPLLAVSGTMIMCLITAEVTFLWLASACQARSQRFSS